LRRHYNESVEFQDASLPGFELGSRGIEASELLSAVQLIVESLAVKRRLYIPRYLECVIQ
jgi:hypothetical protein